MTNRTEDLQRRLTRQLWRARLGDWRIWLAALAGAGLLLLILVLSAHIPAETVYRIGIVENVMPLASRAGPVLTLSVRVGDGLHVVYSRAASGHPALGETACLRLTTELFTGRQTAALAHPEACAAE